MTPTDTPTLTVEQAAKRMRRTPSWVAQLLTAGRITGTKVGTRWQVDAASLEEFIANGRRARGRHTPPEAPPLTRRSVTKSAAAITIPA